MSAEIFHPEILSLLPTFLIPVFIKRFLKQRVSGDPNDPNLEIDHKKPRYRGGSDNIRNLQALSRPDHAIKHFREAQQATDEDIARAEYWAVSQIIARMTRKEFKEFRRKK